MKNGRHAKKLKNFWQSGMTLIEVMIALAIFSIFITAYMSGQGYNLLDSQRMRTEIDIRSVAENIIHEIIVDPPNLSESLTLQPETRRYEEDENFSYRVEWAKFEIQNILNALTETDDQAYDPDAVERQQMQKRINQQVASNLERLIWQVMVTVEDNTTGESFSLSTFLYNDQAEVNFGNF